MLKSLLSKINANTTSAKFLTGIPKAYYNRYKDRKILEKFDMAIEQEMKEENDRKD